MLQNIPTHVIAGPLGAGKTTLIRHLLAQRPAHERWAVLINEFGLVGLDAALLSRDEDGIAIGEVAGGCLCCVNGMPFQVGLGRLLRKSRPDRLFIEPSGLGHPLQLLAQLQQAPWAGVLTINPFVMVVDAQSMARDEPLPEAQQQAFDVAERVVFNKSEAVDEMCKLLITNKFKDKTILWTVQGKVPFSSLPGSPEQIVDSPFEENRIVDNLEGGPAILWTDPSQPICLAQQGVGGWSIGWRWHPGQQFYPQRLQAFLRAWPWRRAKGVIHSVDGWQSFNGLRGDMPAWQSSDWRRDTRIELIFDQPQSQPALQAGLSDCRVS
ncbi:MULTISPECIES: CobW family GTP-binding protein [Pseudomonas]|uniref:CobW family GTP-binding protein n=1 Tax=Pseudomonas TaxID=286 RepID=UPI0013DEA0C9|nr:MULTISPECIES: CobW family GTP-binding protein [Pseudomonas]MCE0907617.1 CobW family GTP-binding protein [Pseudomonas kurunegalensis]QIG21311.1 cobalamin biosynthesis protein CobW [Pseudomonas monteilii]QIG26561.1 cobalamin biosynthesis protein CobW [Pseudomonas monteilii]WJR55978.1 CobW family GTP-binding protein [Pseudomonas kurunegalensis]